MARILPFTTVAFIGVYIIAALTPWNRVVWLATWQGALFYHYYAWLFLLLTGGCLLLVRRYSRRAKVAGVIGLLSGYVAGILALHLMFLSGLGVEAGATTIMKNARTATVMDFAKGLALPLVLGSWVYGVATFLAAERASRSVSRAVRNGS